jgi:opacity protein-like surface antigen
MVHKAFRLKYFNLIRRYTVKRVLFAFAALIAASFASAASAGNLENSGLAKGAYVELKGGQAWSNADADKRGSLGALAGAVGYDLGAVRVEMEGGNLAAGKSTIGTVNATYVSFNGYAEPYTFNNFTPYLTAGVGYAWLNGSGVATADNRDGGAIANIGAGITYTINERWMLDGGYRYFTSLDNVAVRDNNGTSANDFRAHTVTAGLRYGF